MTCLDDEPVLHACNETHNYVLCLFVPFIFKHSIKGSAFLATMIGAGTPPILAALTIPFHTNLFGGMTHYASGQSAVFYGSGYYDMPATFKVGAVVGVCLFRLQLLTTFLCLLLELPPSCNSSRSVMVRLRLATAAMTFPPPVASCAGSPRAPSLLVGAIAAISSGLGQAVETLRRFFWSARFFWLPWKHISHRIRGQRTVFDLSARAPVLGAYRDP